MRVLWLVAVCLTIVSTAACSSGPGPRARATTGTPRSATQPTTASAGAQTTSARTPTSQPPAPSRGTRQVLLRPVTAAGQVAVGFTTTSNPTAIDCSAGTSSPVAESTGILYCAPSAASAIACWQAAKAGTAYCLTDPRAHRLTQYPLQGAFGTAHPSELPPQPIALDLADGTHCTVRNSGAAGSLAGKPDWVPYYFCGADDLTAVWAPPDSPSGGITKADGPWSVQLADTAGRGPLHADSVTTAYFVGTA